MSWTNDAFIDERRRSMLVIGQLREQLRLQRDATNRAVEWHLDYIEGTGASATEFLDYVEGTDEYMGDEEE